MDTPFMQTKRFPHQKYFGKWTEKQSRHKSIGELGSSTCLAKSKKTFLPTQGQNPIEPIKQFGKIEDPSNGTLNDFEIDEKLCIWQWFFN